MRRSKGILTFLAALLLSALLPGLPVWAADGYQEQSNSETGFWAVVDDEGDVLSAEDEERLLAEMEGITAYGNALFYSVVAGGYADDTTSQRLAYAAYESYFGVKDGLVVAIVLDSDRAGGCTVWLEASGRTYDVIGKSYANTIMDNAVTQTRRQASGHSYYGYDGTRNYYGYASVSFEQALRVLAGQRIAQPMKYITSALLALILAVMINFLVVRSYNTVKKPSKDDILKGLYTNINLKDARMQLLNTTRVYSPPSSSGGGSRGGGGHGGGGGGHHGGGGHRG